MTALVGAVMSGYALSYFRADSSAQLRFSTTFWSLWLLLWSSLNALFVSADAFNLYVTLELVTLASVGLVSLKGDANAIRAAFQYLIYALTGSLAYLLGVSLLYAAHGTLDLELLGKAMSSDAVSVVAATAMTIGLLLKAALFPLHFWFTRRTQQCPGTGQCRAFRPGRKGFVLPGPAILGGRLSPMP